MNQIYLAEDNRYLVIYQHQHSIYLRTIFHEQAGKAVLLCADCTSLLTTTQYNNSIYYAYLNKEHHLIIKSIADSCVLYRIPARKDLEIISPYLTTFQKHLVLCYIYLNPSSSLYHFKCFCPFEAGLQCKASIDCSAPPYFQIMTQTDTMLISLSDTNKPSLYSINENFEIESIAPQSKEEPIDYEAIRQEVKKQIEQRFQEKTSQLESELQRQEYLIDSIKKQYNQLMDTAEKYRDEAIKWRSKFISE